MNTTPSRPHPAPFVDVRRWLVFGDVARIYQMADQGPDALLFAALHTRRHELVTAADPFDSSCAVEVLGTADSSSRHLALIDQGVRRAEVRLDVPIPTWDECAATAALRDQVAALRPDALLNFDTLAPLMVLRLTDTPDGAAVTALMCTRMRTVGTVFARVARFVVQPDEPLDSVVAHAIELSTPIRQSVVTEWQGWEKFHQGVEIELKLSLLDEVGIWGLSSALVGAVQRGELTGFVPDVGNELQRWERDQRSFEVLHPPADAGYLAVVNSRNATFVRHKRFTRDSLRRGESFAEFEWTEDAPELIRRRFPEYHVRELPSFSRSRFDVNLESVRTGHFFGIEIDEVVTSEPKRILRQVELEYHRSRLHEGLDGSSIEAELMRLAELVESFLSQRSVRFERSHYSKLSFLRDCRAGRFPGSYPLTRLPAPAE
jgi:hypothetical protein